MNVTPFLTVSPTFTTLSFWFLLVCCYGLYVLIHRYLFLRNVYLLVVSYAFITMWDWRVPVILLGCTVTSFFLSILLEHIRSPRQKQVVISLSIFGYLCVFLYCKYAVFFLSNLNIFLRSIGLPSFFVGLSVFLPLGLSFYLFQIISYLVDIYRGTQKPTKDFLSYALFLGFFAKYLAGPIERASHLLPQFQKVHRYTVQHLSVGIYLIVWGLFQKIVLADNAAIFASYSLLTPRTISANSLTIFLALPLQIYSDFSGYTDIARGIASLFGFTLTRNFNAPYLALSPSDFWRRWHISLSQWCRDYLYIPLGGNRHGFLRTLRNLFLVMIVIGLWHGASWNFIAWGAYHGVLACAYVLVDRYVSPMRWYAKILRNTYVAWSLWFVFVCLGWIIFQTNSSEPFWNVFLLLRPSTGKFFPLVVLAWIPILIFHVMSARWNIIESKARIPIFLRMLFVILCLYSLVFLAPFRQFNFVYQQF